MPAGRAGVMSKPSGSLSFSPTDIANCIVWLDAADASTLSLSGADVVSWTSKDSGNKQFDRPGGGQPTSGANTQNGKNVLTFDGSSSHLTHDAGSDAIVVNPLSIFVVAYMRDITPADSRLVSMRKSATGTDDYQNPNFMLTRGAPSDKLTIGSAGTYSTSTNWPSYTANTMFIFEGTSNNTNVTQRVNGGTAYTFAANAPAAMRYIRIGTSSNQAGNPPGIVGSAEYLNGRIAEVIAYNADLSSGDLAIVRSYLNTKWAIY
jgi:hypothetical protein